MSDVFKAGGAQAGSATGMFFNQLRDLMKRDGSFDMGDLGNEFQLPGYTGPLSTGVTNQQSDILNMTSGYLGNLFGQQMNANPLGYNPTVGSTPTYYDLNNPGTGDPPVTDPPTTGGGGGGGGGRGYTGPPYPPRMYMQAGAAIDPNSLGMALMSGDPAALTHGPPGWGPPPYGPPYGPPGDPGGGGGAPGMGMVPGSSDIINQLRYMSMGQDPTQVGLSRLFGQQNPFLSQLAGFRPNVDTSKLSEFDASSGRVGSGMDALAGFDPSSRDLFGRLLNFSAPQFGGAPMAGSQTFGQASGLINQIQNNPALKQLLSGSSADQTFTDMGNAMRMNNMFALQDQQKNLREQFSAKGLRFGTNYGKSLTDLMARNNADVNAKLGEALPSVLSSKIGGQQAGLGILSQLPKLLTEIGGTQGQLGIGQGQLQLGSAGLQADVAKSLGSLNLGLSQQKLDSMSTSVEASLKAKGLDLNALTALTQAGIDTSKIMQSALSDAAGLSEEDKANVMTAMNNMVQGKIGAAGQGTSSITDLSKLPLELLGQSMGIAGVGQQTQQQGLDAAYQEWVRQQGGLSTMLGALSGTNLGTGPSGASQLGGQASMATIAALLAHFL